MVTSQNEMVVQAEKLASQLIKWRRKLHMHPELSFEEKETSCFVAETLEDIPGMRVQQGIGYPTAVIGTLTNGVGPIMAIRADMDALPIQEKNDVTYRSQKTGVMHACGHDAHTAIALGAAVLLGDAFRIGELQGTVKFIFQPAEERADEHGSTGAPYLVDAGVLNEVDTVIALHMSPENSLGEVKIHDGYSMANVDVFSAEIFGSGGHGAYPHLGTDPIWMLGPVLQALYAITARRISPLEPGVVSIGKINSGLASNVIPSEVNIQGTIRSYHPKVREVIHNELEQAFAMTKSLGGDYQLTIRAEDPALNNDPAINQFIRHVFQDLYPAYQIVETPFGMGGEDFAHMTEAVPGAMFFLGCGLVDEKDRNLHSAYFDIDERVLPVGTSILAETARRFLMG
ncbi:amidohydrolase [Virgibacillus halotolerans]|uniref:M20 metallopeptidase family protein n=1 Tax=Virgibacillus halotolerans TaxID=1071053 RepID=UPI00195FDDE7|nr:M20 family metallopeptidase [Virgibacillus halotolerans]MBM7600700.1 amidohydrolase [Virgibacillus halotolerans]